MLNVQFLSKYRLLIFVGVVLMGILGGVLDLGSSLKRYQNKTKVSNLTRQLNQSKQEERYQIVKDLSELTTASEALEIIASSNIGRDGEMHLLTHVVGQTLYKDKGVNALVECFDDPLYGCAHGLIIEAIVDQGYEVINTMVANCKSQSTYQYHMCLHAIGHGFLAYTNYELEPALLMCDGLKGANETTSLHCYNGVFMENVHGTHDGLDPSTHPSLSSDNPYAPCDSVEAKYKSACYLNQAGWWLSLSGGNYEKVGELCEQMTESYHKECVNNYGRILSTAYKNNVVEIGKLCHKLEPSLASHCIYSVVSSLAGIGANHVAIQFCQNESAIRDRCYTEITKVWREQNLISGYNSQACLLLPTDQRKKCLDL